MPFYSVRDPRISITAASTPCPRVDPGHWSFENPISSITHRQAEQGSELHCIA